MASLYHPGSRFLAVLSALAFLGVGCAQLEDDNLSSEFFTLLDENGLPLEPEGSAGWGWQNHGSSSMHCDGVERGKDYTTCRFRSVCYHDNGAADIDPHFGCYNGSGNFLYFDEPVSPNFEDSTAYVLKVPDVNLWTHKHCHIFGATVVRSSIEDYVNGNQSRVTWLHDPTLFYYRQYMDNYYHVLFDDLLGLFWTLRHHYPELPKDRQILLLDTRDVKEEQEPLLMEMYAAIGGGGTLKRSSLAGGGHLTCFREFVVGPAHHHWGGPGRVQISDSDLRQYADYLMSSLSLLDTPAPTKPALTLLLRKGTREIVNEKELLEALTNQFPGLQVRAMRAESMTFREQMEMMRTTTILMGVHGAGLINQLFLPLGSVVFELFAWNWDRFAYNTIARKIGYHYIEWRNHHREKTFFHLETFGGFPSLAAADREYIINANSKPLELNGIAALAAEKYWINQDTLVTLPEVLALTETALKTGINLQLRPVSRRSTQHSEL